MLADHASQRVNNRGFQRKASQKAKLGGLLLVSKQQQFDYQKVDANHRFLHQLQALQECCPEPAFVGHHNNSEYPPAPPVRVAKQQEKPTVLIYAKSTLINPEKA